MDVRIQQIPGWIPHWTVGPGANLKPHELLLTESRLASVWKTRGNYSFSYAQNTLAYMKLENTDRKEISTLLSGCQIMIPQGRQKSTGKAPDWWEQGWQRVGQRDGWWDGWGRWSEGRRERRVPTTSQEPPLIQTFDINSKALIDVISVWEDGRHVRISVEAALDF